MTKVKNIADKAKKEISVLQQKIEKINSLTEIVKKRAIFEKKKSELETYQEATKENQDFLSEHHFKMKFQSGEYSRDDIFSISNPEILEKAISYFIELFNKELKKQDAEIENLMKL